MDAAPLCVGMHGRAVAGRLQTPASERFLLSLVLIYAKVVVALSPVQGEDVTSIRRGGMGMAERARTLAALQPGCLSPHRGSHPERPALW